MNTEYTNGQQEQYLDEDQQQIHAILSNTPQTDSGRTGMMDEGDMLSILLNKDEVMNSEDVPKEIKSIMLFYNKTLALSNIEKQDIFKILEGFDDLKVSMLMSRPKKDFTWKEEVYWTAVKRWLQIEATRGVDGFEREMEATQIQQVVSEQTHEQIGANKGSGITSGVKKFFGRD